MYSILLIPIHFTGKMHTLVREKITLIFCDIELNFDGELWRRCTFYTNKAFGFATAAAYVNGSGQTDNVELVNFD